MNSEKTDRLMMSRCIGLSKAAGKAGEYPYAAVICRNNVIVAEATNRVARDGDVTRHAEVVAISQAQHALGAVSLDRHGCRIHRSSHHSLLETCSADPPSLLYGRGYAAQKDCHHLPQLQLLRRVLHLLLHCETSVSKHRRASDTTM